MVIALFFTACDNDNSNSTLDFKGTIEISRHPANTLSLSEINSSYASTIVFTGIVKDIDGNVIQDANIGWMTANIYTGSITEVPPNKITVNVIDAAFTPGQSVSVLAAYRNITSSMTITFQDEVS